jgi:hypothetical protein
VKSPYASDDDIARVGAGFLDRSLPRDEWTHAAHFAATLWLMRHRPDIDLGREMPGLIRAFNEAQRKGKEGDTTSYHETITQASLRAARPFLDANPDLPLFRILAALLGTELGNPNWLLQFWSRERLMSVDARRAWSEPDIKPLPF